MSRLRQRLAQIAEGHAKEDTVGQVAKHLADSGDAFEFAARVADQSYRVRKQRPDESDTFRLGYATAAKELALVLRAMRRGEVPTEEQMREARGSAIRESGAEPELTEKEMEELRAPEACPHCGAEPLEVEEGAKGATWCVKCRARLDQATTSTPPATPK